MGRAKLGLVVRAFVLATAVLAVTAPATEAAQFEGFRTPSRNIACLYAPPSDFGPARLRCDILSGLRPEPTRACSGDWTGVSIGLAGRAAATCAGDTVYDPRSRILAYGQTWKRAGLVCVSRTTGLTCTNRKKHGFLLSRERWRLF